MPPVRSAMGARIPGHVFTRPALPAHAIDRPALWGRLTALVDAHRVTTVRAPAGFGKTTALSAWADGCSRPLGWLSLTRADQHPEHLRNTLEGALKHLARSVDAAGPGTDSPVLVIDDLQCASTAEARELLHDLVGRRDLGLRLVLSTRAEPDIGLARLLASGELARLGPDDLALTAREVQQAALSLGRDLDDSEADRLRALTGGWPVAVQLALISTGSGTPVPGLNTGDTFPQLADYLVENVLGQLPDQLGDFVLQGCTCDWLTGQLAADLTDSPRASEQLEELVSRGLPLERVFRPDRDPIYRWHPVMAQAGRALLVRRDPALARSLHRRAAALLRVVDPYEAAAHALAAREPAFAAGLITSQWLASVLRGDSELVDALCQGLPAPWHDDPQILTIRALCVHNLGDVHTAARLAHRARLSAADLPPDRLRAYTVTDRLARLFLADAEDQLDAACADVERFLDEHIELDGALHAGAVLLLGWSRLRLRQVGAAPLLTEATTRCRAEGLDDLADRAQVNLALILAYGGNFAGARRALGQAPEQAAWRREDGAVEAFVRGWLAFWSGDNARALESFRHAALAGGAITSAAPPAAVWLAHTALAARDPGAIAEAERLLAEVPNTTVHGLPWGVYKLGIRAGIAAFRGDRTDALAALDEMAAASNFIPSVRILSAELNWTLGRVQEAEAQARLLLAGSPVYIRVGALTLTALCRHEDGATDAAHVMLEEALGLAAASDLRRAFRRPDPALAELLIEHAARGSAHEAFLASLIADHPGNLAAGDTVLSAREREVLGYLATTLTAAEIHQALFISQNTLKTHLKSIYRKLGVDNRRDAARLAHGLLAS